MISPELFPHLKDYIVKTLITADGTTLLGADDKAGVAEIMTMTDILMQHPEIIRRVGQQASKTISRSWENVIEEVILRYRDIQSAYKLKHGIIVN